jgi:hypothetical protein
MKNEGNEVYERGYQRSEDVPMKQWRCVMMIGLYLQMYCRCLVDVENQACATYMRIKHVAIFNEARRATKGVHDMQGCSTAILGPSLLKDVDEQGSCCRIWCSRQYRMFLKRVLYTHVELNRGGDRSVRVRVMDEDGICRWIELPWPSGTFSKAT